ncbi:MAG: uroporphyrinogen-III synthase [Gallionella sp.]
MSGLKVLVTRPRDQAVDLAKRIVLAGGNAVLFPLLDISPIQDATILNEQLARLAQIDLAIFISPNAVRYGIGAIRDAGQIPPALKIAAVGQGSARALRALGIGGIIAPTERFDSEGLLALPELQHVDGLKVIIFRGDGGRELLGDTLRERGAIVEYAACYQRSKPQQDQGKLLDTLPDVINVTSSEALGYLWAMLDTRARDKLRDTPLFVPHERIAALACEQGWRCVKLTASGDEGLLDALSSWSKETSRARST